MTQHNRMNSEAVGEPEAHQLFQNVSEHYHGCVGGYLGDLEDEDVPPQVRIVSRLWYLLAEIGGGGINDYLWNHCFSLRTLQQVHADLTEVGATELTSLLESGVRTAMNCNIGEFLEDEGAREWATQFVGAPEISPEDLDSLSSRAAYPAGSEIVARYIQQNRKMF
jgi:hypothetical protein